MRGLMNQIVQGFVGRRPLPKVITIWRFDALRTCRLPWVVRPWRRVRSSTRELNGRRRNCRQLVGSFARRTALIERAASGSLTGIELAEARIVRVASWRI